MQEISQALTDQARQKVADVDVSDITQNEAFLGHFQHYREQKKRCLAEEFGNTPQFWLLY